MATIKAKTPKPHKYHSIDPLNHGLKLGASDKPVFIVVLSDHGGVRRLYAMKHIEAVGDLPGPMARHIMETVDEATDYTRGQPMRSYEKFVVHEQEIIRVVRM